MIAIKVETWSQYQQAAMRTCTDSAKNLDYMTTGLMSEVGEVIGKVAKMIRDDDREFTEERKKQIADELGDVLWMIAGCYECCDRAMSWDNIEIMPAESMYDVTLQNAPISFLCRVLSNNALWFVDCYYIGNMSEGPKEQHLRDLLFCIQTIGVKCGVSLHDIAQNNINKLTDRYNRNVIQGNGDNR